MKDIQDMLDILEEIKNLARHSIGMKMNSDDSKMEMDKEESPDHESMESPEFEAGEQEEGDQNEMIMPEKDKDKKIIMIESSKRPIKSPLRMYK